MQLQKEGNPYCYLVELVKARLDSQIGIFK